MFKDNLSYYINKMRLRSNYNYVSGNEITYDFFEEERNAVYISRLHLDALDICGDYRSNIKKILKSKSTDELSYVRFAPNLAMVRLSV